MATSTLPPDWWWDDVHGESGAKAGEFEMFALRQQWSTQWCERVDPNDGADRWCPEFYTRQMRMGGWGCAAAPRPLAAVRRKARRHGGHSSRRVLKCEEPLILTMMIVMSLRQSARGMHPSGRILLRRSWRMGRNAGSPFNYLDHEWAARTCTILSTTTYIDEQIRVMALQPTPEMLRKKVNFKLAELQHLFAFDKAGANVSQQTGLACDEGGRLFGVTTCWGTGSNGTVGQRMHCPDSITHSKYSNGCLEYDDIVVLQSRANGDGRDLQSWVIPSVVAVVISALVLLIGLVFARQHRRRKAAAEAEYNARLIR